MNREGGRLRRCKMLVWPFDTQFASSISLEMGVLHSMEFTDV